LNRQVPTSISLDHHDWNIPKLMILPLTNVQFGEKLSLTLEDYVSISLV
jgi:hypothetical protein